MENFAYNQVYRFKNIIYLVLGFLLLSMSITLAADEADYKKDDITVDGLTVMKTNKMTEIQIKNDVDWSEYTKYQITPVEVSFRRNWKKDYNRKRRSVSEWVTDKDIVRIKETMAKIVYKEFDSALQKKGGLTKVDEADSNTLLFKPIIINLEVYAPDIQTSSITTTYVRRAGRGTLFLEIYDAVSGEILARWVDTREDPDRGYLDWANRVTNIHRATGVVRSWTKRLIEGMDQLKAIK
jgi:hypothetical protein